MTHNNRVLNLLKDGKPHSHHELYALHVIAHSRVSDLRKQGYAISQWRDGDDYLYQLVGEPVLGGRDTDSEPSRPPSVGHDAQPGRPAPPPERTRAGRPEAEVLALFEQNGFREAREYQGR